MKTLFVTIFILLGSIASAAAQDFYLPSSSKSKKAVKTMHEAAELTETSTSQRATRKLNIP